jgi:hypothetical protein
MPWESFDGMRRPWSARNPISLPTMILLPRSDSLSAATSGQTIYAALPDRGGSGWCVDGDGQAYNTWRGPTRRRD